MFVVCFLCAFTLYTFFHIKQDIICSLTNFRGAFRWIVLPSDGARQDCFMLVVIEYLPNYQIIPFKQFGNFIFDRKT